MKSQTLALLNVFMNRKIPLEYKTFDVAQLFPVEKAAAKLDLMYCHEELFDYSWCILHHHTCDKKSNFVGVASTALSDEFVDCLIKLKQAVPSLHEYINLLLEVICALKAELSDMQLCRR